MFGGDDINIANGASEVTSARPSKATSDGRWSTRSTAIALLILGMTVAGCATPNAAITFENRSDSPIGITATFNGESFEDHYAGSPSFLFVGPDASRSRSWSTEEDNVLCQGPNVIYYVVEFELAPREYVPGETPVERFTVLDTIGPSPCWDSKRPTYGYEG